jgi:acyl transferase domain-containing protein/NAD(P)-dependent dehydrogenase (short-subunit alcohol dehydrogenase family)/acyl carrier protein
MRVSAEKAVAIVGVGALMPDAPNAPKFWQNVRDGRYSIKDVIAERWDPNLYYDPDPKAPDKTYSKIGGWVRDWEWDPLKWKLPIPPRVSLAMDLTQKWAVVTAREALSDYGYPARPLNAERTAVILGNAMAGDTHLYSAARILFPEYAEELIKSPSYAALPPAVRQTIMEQVHEGVRRRTPPITEDTMPGELANIVAGRIAALYDFKGPNFVADAACASAMAAMSAAIEGLNDHDYDAVLTGGIDTNMSPSTFVKFCKIGALSATGTRPYAAGSDGFVMGEGAVTFIFKRLADAERDGDKIYAVIRGMGGSSDGKGKGITAPNPVGQVICIRRAWQKAGVTLAPGDMIEGHGTSTPVGDAAEFEGLTGAFKDLGLPSGSIPLGSVKSNIGHLKGAAGAAGILKAMFALKEKELPPSLNFNQPNPNIDFKNTPFYVNTRLKPWEVETGKARRAAVSAFGFGGTNFHVVLEEYIPGRIAGESKTVVSVPESMAGPSGSLKTPLRGALVIGADSEAAVVARLLQVQKEATAGTAPVPAPPAESDLRANVRLAIDYGNAAELADKIGKAVKAFEENQAGRWKALRAKGIFLGKGPAPKVAFLFTGQGSQYVNMLQHLRVTESIVAKVYEEADRTMEPLLGNPLTQCIYLDESDEAALAAAEEGLKQTAITQPAVLATETALARLLGAYGIAPDMVMGHSLGEYGALVAAGAISFDEALKAVSARGNEMTKCALDDNGMMAAVGGPIEEIEKVLGTIEDYVVVANINSTKEAVIGGSTIGVRKAIAALGDAGLTAKPIPVSHAFHTKIVAPAGDSLAKILSGMDIRPPSMPIVTNVTGEFYPMGPGVVPEMIKLLGRQVSSPVQFIKGLNTLYAAGARIFVDVGPKRILYGFVDDVLGGREGVVPLFGNHPRIGDAASLNLALCGLYAAGLGFGEAKKDPVPGASVLTAPRPAIQAPAPQAAISAPAPSAPAYRIDRSDEPRRAAAPEGDRYTELGKLFADFMDRGFQIYSGGKRTQAPVDLCITGAALGLPGVNGVFDDSNVERILRGDVFIDQIPMHLRQQMVEKNITRLVKSEGGEGRFESIESMGDVIKLAARAKEFDLIRDFGVPEDRMPALDRVTKLAIGAGIDALRDAGIPLVMRYKTTTKGTQLPDRWQLPEELRDDTGILFTSAFPGCDSFEQIIGDFYRDRTRRERLNELSSLRELAAKAGANGVSAEIERRIQALTQEVEQNVYHFDRRFLFRVLSMGHSQFAEYIGARGPNTATNGACASSTQAIALAGDWIRTGRCKRVIIVSADDITSDNLMGWFGSGFLASGSAATDAIVEDAATPFDRRRHGLILGMGASAVVLESLEAARERGIRPICHVMGSVVANSAYHGTRLDVSHIRHVMEKLISEAEAEWGINRFQIAPETVFVSHETYTPARGGSASAEVFALRHVFKEATDQIIVANTKGATGHPMAVGIEDVVSVKILETGLIPAVPNFKEVDPELGPLNLSKGGAYPVQYALRLGAGFGSQICMTLMRWAPSPDGRRQPPSALGYHYRIENQAAWNQWLKRLTGYDAPELEVVQRTLRAKDQGFAARYENGVAAVSSAPAQPVLAQAAIASPAPVAEKKIAIVAAPEAVAVPAARPMDEVQKTVMQIISEKTGYPADMLDLDLDMEADLGIDTVKQAEMFAAIRAAYDIPRDDNLKLRDFPTLAHAMQVVYDRRPDLKAAAAAVAAETPAAPATPVSDGVKETVLQIIAEKTGYPPDMLDLDLDLEADLGIDTVKQAEMFAAIRAAYDIPREDNLKLRDFPTLAHTIQFVYDRRPDLKAAAAAPAAEKPVEAAAPAMPVPQKVETAPAASAGAEVDPVKEMVLNIIAEKTGYPPDMLDLDLDLEADLGIDTVKQAEMFASIRAAYDIPREENLKLRDFPTLAHIIQFVYDRKPGLKKTATAETQPESKPAAAPPTTLAAPAPVVSSLDAANAVPRRVPVPKLRPSLSFCKPTGVVLKEGSRVIVMPDQGGVGKALIGKLEKLGVQALLIDGVPDAKFLAKYIDGWKEEGPIQGIFWLPALDSTGDISGMSYVQWREATRVRAKLLFATIQSVYAQIGEAGTFLISATRMGGQHGYDGAGATDPLGGAVSGFTKAYKREKLNATVKVVDFESSRKTSALADLLLEEVLLDPGAVEIGYKDGQRWTIGLEEQPAGDAMPVQLNKETVFLVTGAAGSIVSAITSDLAAASGGTFYLMDRTPEPDAGNSDLARLTSDTDGLKRDIFERLKLRGERATPAMVDKEIASLERSRAALDAILAVRAAGGTAHYYSVDLTDTAAVAKVVKDVADRHGRVDVLMHAAGLEISHTVPDKKPVEFDLVFDVKSDGWFNLVSSIGNMPLGAAVVFSSVAGRFGNAGQTDYSSANDLLCKCISNFRSTRIETHGVAIDWTAWKGIGMASRGSIPVIMKQAGIDMLPPEAGIPIVRRELLAGTRGELVIGQKLGILVQEFDPQGGLETANGGVLDVALKNRGVMIGAIEGMGLHSGLTIETTLDPAKQPFLFDHQISATPVLPGVMGLEAMAETAKLLFPDRHIGAIEDVNFMAPFKFYRNQPRAITIHADFFAENEDIVAHCRLVGSRMLHGQSEPELTTHFTGRVRLVHKAPHAEKESAISKRVSGAKVDALEIYKVYFHGPAYQVIESAWRAGGNIVAAFAKNLPVNHEPPDLPVSASPRYVELCFQTASLAGLALQSRLGLPYAFRQLTVVSAPEKESNAPYYAIVVSNQDGTYDAKVVDGKGKVYLILSGYRTMDLPDPIQVDLVQPIKSALQI